MATRPSHPLLSFPPRSAPHPSCFRAVLALPLRHCCLLGCLPLPLFFPPPFHLARLGCSGLPPRPSFPSLPALFTRPM
jgi:hypothetical protein